MIVSCRICGARFEMRDRDPKCPHGPIETPSRGRSSTPIQPPSHQAAPQESRPPETPDSPALYRALLETLDKMSGLPLLDGNRADQMWAAFHEHCGQHFSLTRCDFSKRKINSLRLNGCSFVNCDFSGTQWAFSFLENCTLEGSCFRGISCICVPFINSNCTHCDFSQANIFPFMLHNGNKFDKSNFSGAVLRMSHSVAHEIVDSKVRSTLFSGACSFTGANMNGCVLRIEREPADENNLPRDLLEKKIQEYFSAEQLAVMVVQYELCEPVEKWHAGMKRLALTCACPDKLSDAEMRGVLYEAMELQRTVAACRDPLQKRKLEELIPQLRGRITWKWWEFGKTPKKGKAVDLPYPAIPITRNPQIEVFVNAVVAVEKEKECFMMLSSEEQKRMGADRPVREDLNRTILRRIAAALSLPEPTAGNRGFDAITEFCIKYDTMFLK